MANIHKEFQLTTKDGLQLFAQEWIPESNFENIIILIHGIGEHSSRYDHWAERFCAQQIAVVSMDLRGHGKSQGKQGHVPSLQVFLDDINVLIDYAKQKFSDKKILLYGHSMGGNLVLNYLLKQSQQMDAAIVTSPWIRIPFKIPAMKLALAKFANKVFPSLVQPSGLVTEYISRNDSVVENYKVDPLNHDKISARLFMELYVSGLQMVSQAKEIKIPMLLLHGTADQITSAKATEEFGQNAAENVSYHLWEGYFHELHNDVGNDAVFDYISNWINNLPK